VSREELPKALATWYDYTKWVLDRVEGFPKNQRLSHQVMEVLELLVAEPPSCARAIGRKWAY
jgi:hypothetical protein